MKLSVVIIAGNEEANLPRCLDAVKWADEIVVVDSGSVDRTVPVAQEYGARVIQIEWAGFGASKQAGVDAARGEWILSVDADEVVPEALADEIKAVLRTNDQVVGYYLPRLTQFLGRWMKHGGWYPDHVLRLFRRDRGGFDGAVVHESVVVNGPTARLQHALRHFCYPDLDSYFEKLTRYTTLAAQDLHEQGRRTSWFKIVVNPVAKFTKQYCLRGGWLDGLEGLVLALLSAGYVMTKYVKLRDLNRRSAGETNEPAL
jgi:glycosyltransferase involved in cell wall biosynthesis